MIFQADGHHQTGSELLYKWAPTGPYQMHAHLSPHRKIVREMEVTILWRLHSSRVTWRKTPSQIPDKPTTPERDMEIRSLSLLRWNLVTQMFPVGSV